MAFVVDGMLPSVLIATLGSGVCIVRRAAVSAPFVAYHGDFATIGGQQEVVKRMSEMVLF